MSEAAKEVLYQHVDSDRIVASVLGTDALDEAEPKVAISAVARERAQEVADEVAAELGNRAIRLKRLEGNLQETLIDTRTQLSIIESVLYARNESERPNPEARREWFRYYGNPERFLDSLASEPSFTLWLGPKSSSSSPSLQPWVDMHRSELKERFGKHAVNFERASNCLARAVVQNWTPVRGVFEVIQSDDDNSGEVGLVIAEPRLFISEAMHLTYFGVKAAVALLCIADMQREEREN